MMVHNIAQVAAPMLQQSDSQAERHFSGWDHPAVCQCLAMVLVTFHRKDLYIFRLSSIQLLFRFARVVCIFTSSEQHRAAAVHLGMLLEVVCSELVQRQRVQGLGAGIGRAAAPRCKPAGVVCVFVHHRVAGQGPQRVGLAQGQGGPHLHAADSVRYARRTLRRAASVICSAYGVVL